MKTLSSTRLGLYAAFAGLGGTAATVPALIPSLEQRLGADVLMAVPFLFGGLLMGVLASSPLLIKLRAASVVATGAALQAAGLLGVTVVTTVSSALVVVLITGIGFGLTEAAGSLTVKRTTGPSTTRLLSALMGTVAAVAALSPIGIALVPGGMWLVPAIVLVLHLLASLTLLRAPELIQREHALDQNAVRSADSSQGRTSGIPSARRVVIVAGVALLLYVGVETVFSGWSAVIPATVLDISPRTAALGTSAFWLCMAIGRFLASLLLHRGIRPVSLLTACLFFAALGMLTTLPFTGRPHVIVGMGVAVLAMAPVYSIVLGEALDRLPSRIASRTTGPLVACGALGGTVFPAALVLGGFGPTESATAVVTAAVFLILATGALTTLLRSDGQRQLPPATTLALTFR